MSRKRFRRKQKKNVMNFLIFYAVICVFFIASYTFSRYVTTISDSTEIEFAKFKVTVNDINVTENKPFELKFSETSNFVGQKVAPNNSGYFEFIINPAGTEVSLEYDFKFMIDEMDEDFKLLYFTVNDDATHYDIIDNTATGDLILPSNERGFNDNEKASIKVYWSWDEKEDTYNPNIDDLKNKSINVFAIVRQKIK